MSARVIERVDFANEDGSIILYDWMADEMRDGRNLVRIDAKGGNVIWRASPPQAAKDFFAGMDWDGTTLTATTWSCYRVRINLPDGQVTVLEFTK